MAGKLKILVWEGASNADEEPVVDVTMPTYLAKWADRMMKLMPKKAKEEMWGEGVDLGELNLAELIKRRDPGYSNTGNGLELIRPL